MSSNISRARIDTAKLRHLVLDRDGVLNRTPLGGYVTSADAWEWLPGAREGLALLRQVGIRVSVATNQSGVGRGLMSVADLDAVHGRMLREAEIAGGHIAAIYYCPHSPGEGCPCRKPAPGLIERAVFESGVLKTETLVVGDDVYDMEAAFHAGVPAVLVLTGRGRQSARHWTTLHAQIFGDLLALCNEIVGGMSDVN